MNSKRHLKQQLYAQCVAYIEERHTKIINQIKDIQESLTSETKSSAGDKHETGRAMLQLEREKVGQQLAEIEKVKANLSKIDTSITTDRISLGSIVYTSYANYFLAISAGTLEVDGITYFAISPYTPIGLLLHGKSLGDSITFRDQTYQIENIY